MALLQVVLHNPEIHGRTALSDCLGSVPAVTAAPPALSRPVGTQTYMLLLRYFC